MATVEIKAHAGVRNDISSERFSPKDLLTGRNIDIDETGKVFRRLGSQLLSGGSASALWSSGEHGYYVLNGVMQRVAPDLSQTAMVSGVGSEVAYEAVNHVVYWTDGVQSGRIKDAVNDTWGVPVPPTDYQISAGFGALPAGTYGVTVVNVRNGMESGAHRGQFITLGANSSIQLDGLRAGYAKRVYVTRPDGEVFFAAADLAVGGTSCVISDFWTDELPLRTQFKSPAPAGQIVGYYAGRMYVAQGAYLFYSDPYEYELFDLRRNFVPFAAPVAVFAPVNDGVYIATDTETFFLAGREPDEFVSKKVLDVGGVRGTMVRPVINQLLKGELQGEARLWMSKKGVVLGVDGGQFLTLTADRYIPPAGATRGGGLFKIRSGTPQYVVSTFT